MAKVIGWILSFVLVVALAACAQPSVSPTPTPTPPDPTPPPPGPEDRVIIPPTTKVLDAQSLDALIEVTESGTLVFDANSAGNIVVAADIISPNNIVLEPGDVVVAEPSEAAPFGLLRTVVSVSQEGDQILVETAGAEIRDAIHQGSLSVVYEFPDGDVIETQIHHQGIEAQGLDFTLNTDFGTGGIVRATGTVKVDPILEFDLGISCNDVVRIPLTDTEICAEIPDLNVRTRVGIEQSALIQIKGDAKFTLDRRIKLATQTYAPQTYAIAGFPVTIVPKLEIYLGVDGSLSASVLYSAQQNMTLAVGFEYDSDSGFRDLSERTASFSNSGVQFEGSVELAAHAGAQFELLLYGLVGPYGSVEAGPRLEANVNGLIGTSLLWKLAGCIALNVGIDSVDVLDLSYDKEVFRACATFSDRDNSPPSAFIESPQGGSQVFVGVPFELRSLAQDNDGQDVTCRWTSNNNVDPFPITDCEAPVVFTTTGSRTLTLVVTDSLGATASNSSTFTVQPQPDIVVTVTSPTDGSNLNIFESVTLSGSASGGQTPYEYTWTVRWPVDENGVDVAGAQTFDLGTGSNTQWESPQDTLGITCEDGFARVELTAVDANGLIGVGRAILRIQVIC